MSSLEKYKEQIVWIIRGVQMILSGIAIYTFSEMATMVKYSYDFAIKTEVRIKNIEDAQDRIEKRFDLGSNANETAHAGLSARIEMVNQDLGDKIEDLTFYKMLNHGNNKRGN
jgi:hypothetical protein